MGADTQSGVRIHRLTDGTVVIRDGAGGEIRLKPGGLEHVASALMEFALDAGDWPTAQIGGAT